MESTWRTNLQALIAHIGNVSHLELLTGIHRQTLNAIAKGQRQPLESHMRILERAYGLPSMILDRPLGMAEGHEELARAAQRVAWINDLDATAALKPASNAGSNSFFRAMRWSQKKGFPLSAWLAREVGREYQTELPEALAPAADASEVSLLIFSAKLNPHGAKELRDASKMYYTGKSRRITPPNPLCEQLQCAEFETVRAAIRQGALDLADKRVLGWVIAYVRFLDAQGALVGATKRGATMWVYRQRVMHFEEKSKALARERAAVNNVFALPKRPVREVTLPAARAAAG